MGQFSLVLMSLVGAGLAALAEGKGGSSYALERRMWGPYGPWGFELELGDDHTFCEKLPEWLEASQSKGGDANKRAFLRFGDQVTLCNKESKELKEQVEVPALSRDLLYLQIAILILFHCLSPGWSAFFPQLYFSLALTGCLVACGWNGLLWVGAVMACCNVLNLRVTWWCLTLSTLSLHAFLNCPSCRFLAGHLTPHYVPMELMDTACDSVSSWFCSDPPMGKTPFLDWMAIWWKSAAMSVAYPLVYAHVVGLFHRKWVAILGYSLATLLGAYGRTDDQSVVMVSLILLVVYQWVAGLCAEVPEEIPPPPRPVFPEDPVAAPSKPPAPKANRPKPQRTPLPAPMTIPDREDPPLKGTGPPPSALRRESTGGSRVNYQSHAPTPSHPQPVAAQAPTQSAPSRRGTVQDVESDHPIAPSRQGVKRPRDGGGDADPRSKKSKTD